MLNLVEHIQWKDDALVLLDQTLLPTETKFISLKTIEEVWEAIKVLRVRGAPAIGVSAAYGLYLGVRDFNGNDVADFVKHVDGKATYLESSRPTAVNLSWAVRKVFSKLKSTKGLSVTDLKALMLDEAHKIFAEDHEACRQIGVHGARLIKSGQTVLTHCNAGGLATARYGTALAPVYVAHEQGMKVSVIADETRPLLQGARLTAFELQRAGIPVTVICDNMAAVVMSQKKVDLVIVGADRIAANGDFANKIGTYGVAILAKEHGIPFYCAAPLSTFDMNLSDGSKIPIEERAASEISHGFGKQTTPDGISVFNPAFDVTPHSYVRGFICEKGVIEPPFETNLKALFSR